MRLACSPVVVVAAVLAGCGGGSEAKESTADAAVVVTRDAGSLPTGCSPREVAVLVAEFLDAFSRGDTAAAGLFAPELAPHGGWYSVTEGTTAARRHFVARDRDELRRYVAARHGHDERLGLVELRVNSARGDFEFFIERRADDLEPLGIRTPRAGGKGAVDCERRKIVVWSMGMPYGGDRLCPVAAAGRNAVTACTRRALGA